MKKIVNFRFWFICFLAIMLAIFFCCKVFVNQNLKLTLLIISVVSLIFLLIFCVKTKKKIFVVLAVVFVFVSSAIFNICLRSKSFDKYSFLSDKQGIVVGRICSDVSYSSNGNIKLELDNVEFVCEGKTYKTNYNYALYINPTGIDTQKLKYGYKVSANVKLNMFALNGTLENDLSYLSRDVVGYSYARSSQILYGDYDYLSFKEKIRFSVLDKLESGDMKYSSVAYAMLFGDSEYIDLDVKNIFYGTGVAHILAVSGLHISVLILLLSFILDKLKMSKMTNFYIIFAILLIYSYLCDFSFSVCRASVMTLLAIFAKARGKKYDSLSSLCFVGALYLIICPLKLFSASFWLSAGATFGIIILQKPLARLFNKVFYKKFANSLALTISVEVGIMFVILYFFGAFPVCSFFANIVTIPIVSVLYLLLVIFVFISYIMPFLSGFLFSIFDFGMKIVVQFNNFLNVSNLKVFGSVRFSIVIVAFLFIFVLSDYVFKKNIKHNVSQMLKK